MRVSLCSSFFVYAFLNTIVVADMFWNKPAVIMVPGAFHSPEVFDKVKGQLSGENYKYLDSVALPSVGHLVDREADIDTVKSVLCKSSTRNIISLLC